MKKEKQIGSKKLQNPYEKTFDDANKLLKKFGGMDYLEGIPSDHERTNSDIPFPYGNNAIRPYNFN